MHKTMKREIPMDQLVSRQIHLWERTYQKVYKSGPETIRPCITISKEIGSPALELARMLAEKLNWKWFDREIVEYIANNAQVRENMVEILDEKTQSEIHNWVLTLLNHYALAHDRYFKHLVTAIRTIGEHGQSIILGRGANFILPPERVLRLKIVAPTETRIKYLMHEQSLGEKEAEKLLRRLDAERKVFVQRFFHTNVENPLHYDLVVNLGTLSLSSAVEIVIRALWAKFPIAQRSTADQSVRGAS